MKTYIHTEDIDRIKALMDSLNYKGSFELEIDNSSGIGAVTTVHVPQTINCLQGIFSYVISAEETW